jgi:hypothetical protein
LASLKHRPTGPFAASAEVFKRKGITMKIIFKGKPERDRDEWSTLVYSMFEMLSEREKSAIPNIFICKDVATGGYFSNTSNEDLKRFLDDKVWGWFELPDKNKASKIILVADDTLQKTKCLPEFVVLNEFAHAIRRNLMGEIYCVLNQRFVELACDKFAFMKLMKAITEGTLNEPFSKATKNLHWYESLVKKTGIVMSKMKKPYNYDFASEELMTMCQWRGR